MIAAAFVIANVWAADFVLDLSKSTNPQQIIFTGEYWDSTYNANVSPIEFAPFQLSYLAGGNSYGGTYFDGFTICKSGDNAEPFDGLNVKVTTFTDGTRKVEKIMR